MRNDAQTQPERNPPGRPAGAETRLATPPRAPTPGVGRLKVPALLSLVAATSWVVANWASVWLVPPYLGVMTLLLWPSPRSPRGPSGAPRIEAARVPADSDRSESAGGAAAAGDSDSSALASAVGSVGGSPSSPPPAGETPTTATVAPKRGRGRPRKTSKPSAEPVEVAAATWVEVGPGKFVRAEDPTAVGPVGGPQSLVEPESVLATDDEPTIEPVAPSLILAAEPPWSALEVEQEAPVGLDFLFRYHPGASLVPSLAPDPGPSTAAAAVATIAPPLGAAASHAEEVAPPLAAAAAEFAHESALDAPTADGTAPQVDGLEALDLAEETCLDDAATSMESADSNLDACWLTTEPVEPDGFADLDPWNALDALAVAPTVTADVAGDEIAGSWDSEDGSGPEATVEVRFPDLDRVDADPAAIKGVDPGPATASRGEPDAVAPGHDVHRGGGSSGLSVRLGKAFRPTRAGLDQGPSRSALGGRSGRPHRSARRPIDPRRPSGRRMGRPRQITRASPPRSPPSTRLFR